MNLAVFHFHLNRGGVTRVIVNHLLALARDQTLVERVLVVCGGRRDGWPTELAAELAALDVRLTVVEQLEYDAMRRAAGSIERDEQKLATALRAALDEADFTPETTLLHFHNHALGKNQATPGAIRRLVGAGYRVLLQMHDFAEDMRPEAYRQLRTALTGDGRPSLACQLYPQASGIHYAVLNQRDHHALRGLGVADACLHWLPNPAADFDALPDRMAARRKLDCHLPIDRRVVLYPVRGIRRKNLGELLLHAVLFGAHASYVCSLAPQNPVELQSYRAWERRSTSLGLPIHWDTGGRYGMSFPENLAASDATITTSVAEGFGMVFLESWLAGRVLMGRDLPEITADFQAAGMDFATLAPIFHVPLDGFVSREAVTKPLQESLVGLHEAYETPLPAEAEVRDQLDALVAGDTVDFAFLTPPLQAGLIERVAERPAERQRLRDVNPTLSAAHTLADGPRDELIRRNAAIVRREYDLAALGKRLAALYTVLYDRPAAGAVTGPPHEQAIISRFLRLDRLHPTRLA